jgi:predicted MFS family arabinose efflux permease
MTITKSRAASVWFTGIFLLFAARGVLMSTWSNQGPAIKSSLDLSSSEMGLYQMVISIGSIAGVVVAGRLLHKMGSRYISLFSYLLMAASIIGLGFVVDSHSFLFAVVLTALIGAPFGIADFDNNFEAGEIDRRSGRNQVPMLHFGYSGAVLAGGLLTGLFITLNFDLSQNFMIIGVIVAILAVVGSFMIPKSNGKIDNSEHETGANRVTVLDVLKDKRNVKIVAIAFAFVVTEASAVLWIPITLTDEGMSGSDAALAFSVFALAMALMRVVGGRIADRLGRVTIIRYLSILALIGIAIFMATPLIHLPYLGIVLWGIGDSIGISMAVAAMSDNPKGAHAKQTLLWTVVYFANFTVGPVLGILSSFVGNYMSFIFPIATLAMAFAFASSVKSQPSEKTA